MLQIRYAEFGWDGAEVPAVLICGDTEAEVTTVSDIALEHYETPGAKPQPVVAFTKRSEYDDDFELDFHRAGSVQIERIDPAVGANLAEKLASVPSYVVLLAHGSNPELVSPSIFSMVKRDVYHHGNAIHGPSGMKVDIAGLLQHLKDPDNR